MKLISLIYRFSFPDQGNKFHLTVLLPVFIGRGNEKYFGSLIHLSRSMAKTTIQGMRGLENIVHITVKKITNTLVVLKIKSIGFWGPCPHNPHPHMDLILCPVIMSPQPKGRGHITFGADLVGVCVRVASCLHSVFWTNGKILIKPAQTHYWDRGKKCLDFGDLNFIFKVTSMLWMSNFDQNSLSASYLLNQYFKYRYQLLMCLNPNNTVK